jgi:hypothetical protein
MRITPKNRSAVSYLQEFRVNFILTVGVLLHIVQCTLYVYCWVEGVRIIIIKSLDRD